MGHRRPLLVTVASSFLGKVLRKLATLLMHRSFTHRPQSSSFLALLYRILNMNPKKELLWGLWVVRVRSSASGSTLTSELETFRVEGLGFRGSELEALNPNWKR